MVVNDNAGCQVSRGALGFIASKLAPTDAVSVGAGLPAMVVNDNAGWQVPRGALGFIASKLAPTEIWPRISPYMGYYTHLTGPFSPNLRLAWHTVKQLVH
jgi:hypothetical protein